MNAVFRLGDPSPWKYFLGVSVALGILFAALGPDGTAQRGGVAVLLQWLAQAVIPMALCIVAHVLLHRSSAFDRLNPWLKLLASGCLGAMAFSPIAYAIDHLLGEALPPGRTHLGEWLDELGAVLVPVAFTWVAINAPFQLGYTFRKELPAPAVAPTETPPVPVPAAPVAPAAPPDVSPEPYFLSLVPAPLRGEVLHMKSELHYLSVTTTRGQSLILYNLRDAIQELPADAGFQTHRSYWANLAHVKAFAIEGRLATLTMSDGAKVPVSRSQVKALRARLGSET